MQIELRQHVGTVAASVSVLHELMLGLAILLRGLILLHGVILLHDVIFLHGVVLLGNVILLLRLVILIDLCCLAVGIVDGLLALGFCLGFNLGGFCLGVLLNLGGLFVCNFDYVVGVDLGFGNRVVGDALGS
ncbi:hypothetical protein PG993_009005 [Apiospora rasikravindrae]|uniref:Uncharacterized protein n=1 Tax=Apiospora rasikravindrae TaxID=990691 RepID=A0ABR1SJW9_9PEZI